VYRLRSDGQAEAIASFADEHTAYGAAALPDGALLVASWNGTLRRVAPDGRVSIAAELGRPVYQITANASGDVFAATYAGDVLRLAADGSQRELRTGFGQGRLVAVVAGDNGSVYAAERGGEGRILRIEASGRSSLVFRARGARFYGIAIDDVFLYALDLGRRELLRIPVPAAPPRPMRAAGS
jgi:glucose/arabinose dehydrogenase